MQPSEYFYNSAFEFSQKNLFPLLGSEYQVLKASEIITCLCLQRATIAASSSQTSLICSFSTVWNMKTTEQTSETGCSSGGWSRCRKAKRKWENSTTNDCWGTRCGSVIKAPSRWRWWMCRTLAQLSHRLSCLLSAVSFDGWFVNWSVLHPKSESFF